MANQLFFFILQAEQAHCVCLWGWRETGECIYVQASTHQCLHFTQRFSHAAVYKKVEITNHFEIELNFEVTSLESIYCTCKEVLSKVYWDVAI